MEDCYEHFQTMAKFITFNPIFIYYSAFTKLRMMVFKKLFVNFCLHPFTFELYISNTII